MDARRVFISYAHDHAVDGFMATALRLAESLRERGVESVIDRWHEHNPPFWPRWMADQIRDADFVLCLASPLYKRRFEDLRCGAAGHGAKWEGALITNAMYGDIVSAQEKYIAVLLAGVEASEIPDVLLPHGSTYYKWEEGSADDEAIYRRLTGQPLLEPPPLGPLIPYPRC